jgi:hypothetical protein
MPTTVLLDDGFEPRATVAVQEDLNYAPEVRDGKVGLGVAIEIADGDGDRR